jgi:putative PEP-CTERM system TPR-repeat lipoprotein
MNRRIRTVATSVLLAGLLLTSAGCDFFVSPEQRYQRAQALVAQGEYRHALVELKNALQKQGDLHDARVLLAEVALWLGDPSSAAVELQRVPAADAEAHPDLQIRIDLAMDRAEDVLTKLAEPVAGLAPERASLYRGMALQKLGRNEEAEQAFEAAAQADPQMIEAQVGIAETQATRGATAQALERSGKLVEQHPQSALAWYAHGSILSRGGSNAEAKQALLRARELADKQLEVPLQASLLSKLIEVQLVEREIDAARANLKALERLVAGSPVAVLMSARVAMATEDYAAAANDLRRVLNAAPQFVHARYLLGVALTAQGNLEQASLQLAQVVERAPEHLEARQLLAQVRMRLRDPDGALRVLVPAIQSNQENAALASLFEFARAQAGASGAAVDTLEKAVRSAPDNRALQLQLASAYLQSGAADKAATLLRSLQSSGDALDARREVLLLEAITRSEGKGAARARIEALLKSHPGDPTALSLAAAFYSGQDEHDRALALLNQALAKDPSQPELLFALARVQWSARRVAAARQTLERLLAAHPDNLLAQMSLVELDAAQGDAQAAAARLEAMHEAHPKAVEPLLLLARLALARDDAKAADRYVSTARQAAPERVDVLQSAGLLYLQSGRFDRARDLFLEATRKHVANPQHWLNLGRAQLGLDQRGAARESFERALSLQPNWLAAVGALAFLEVQDGNGEAAVARIDALKRAGGNDPETLALEGEIYRVLHRYEDASRAFEAAASARPSAELAVKRFQVRLAGRLPAPAAPLEQWVRDHPDDITTRALLADAYIKLDDPRRASEQYRQIVQREPRHVASLNNLAWLYYEARDPRALETARQAYALAPESAAVQDTLGWILVEAGKVAEGLPLLEKAASRPNASPDIQYHHAAALARAGQRQTARERLSSILSAQQSFPAREAAENLLDALTAEQ